MRFGSVAEIEHGHEMERHCPLHAAIKVGGRRRGWHKSTLKSAEAGLLIVSQKVQNIRANISYHCDFSYVFGRDQPLSVRSCPAPSVLDKPVEYY